MKCYVIAFAAMLFFNAFISYGSNIQLCGGTQRFLKADNSFLYIGTPVSKYTKHIIATNMYIEYNIIYTPTKRLYNV